MRAGCHGERSVIYGFRRASSLTSRPTLVALVACISFFSAIDHAAAEPGQQSSQISARQSLLAQCWPGAALGSQTAEINPKSWTKAARAKAPNRTLAAFESIPVGLQGAIRRVELNDGSKKIALTFDLCEQSHEVAGYDGRIFDILRRERVSATLFAGGKWLMTHGDRAQQLMLDPLFEIANHGWSHRDFQRLAGKNLETEITFGQRAYEHQREVLSKRACMAERGPVLADIPKRIGLFRYPFGTCNAKSLRMAADNGVLAVQWDVSTGDAWRLQSAKDITRVVMSKVRPGSIILAHANGRGFHTAEALPALINRLRSKGYKFVTVSELLASGRPVIEKRCYSEVPGDTEKWAAGARGTPSRAARKVSAPQ